MNNANLLPFQQRLHDLQGNDRQRLLLGEPIVRRQKHALELCDGGRSWMTNDYGSVKEVPLYCYKLVLSAISLLTSKITCVWLEFGRADWTGTIQHLKCLFAPAQSKSEKLLQTGCFSDFSA